TSGRTCSSLTIRPSEVSRKRSTSVGVSVTRTYASVFSGNSLGAEGRWARAGLQKLAARASTTTSSADQRNSDFFTREAPRQVKLAEFAGYAAFYPPAGVQVSVARNPPKLPLPIGVKRGSRACQTAA